MPVQIDPARVEVLTEEQSAKLAEKLPRSIEFAKRASQSLAGGVACTWHALPACWLSIMKPMPSP